MDGGTSRAFDTVIRGARVFDGTGAAPCTQDVAVRDGRIAAVGEGLAAGREEVDARGLWLTPGLLDIHTHFDLEVELAPGLPEAVRHGSTTVVMSNCSLGLAYGNQRRGGADPIVDCFARVENVPKHVLTKVADAVDWSDSGDYLEHFDRLPLGPNVVAMIPHSMLRIEVMGMQDSVERDPTEAELTQMERLVDKGMREGYVGFSTDSLPFHFLANQPNVRKQIPTQFAPYRELKRLTNVVRRWGRVWQATPPKDSRLGVFRNFLLTSGRFFGKPLKVTAVAAIDLAMNRSILKMGLLLSHLLNSRLVAGISAFRCCRRASGPGRTASSRPSPRRFRSCAASTSAISRIAPAGRKSWRTPSTSPLLGACGITAAVASAWRASSTGCAWTTTCCRAIWPT